MDGIESSRRTIVILSQHFLESEWCEFEFEMSQHQVLQDPNFKMIVILMQSEEELNKIPRYDLCLKFHYRSKWPKNNILLIVKKSNAIVGRYEHT